MPSNVANSNSQDRNVQVDLGGGQLVSMQAVQHIYNEITGRTEEISRPYTINHCAGFDDLKQLHIKICQLHEQYNVVSKNCSVTLFHLDDQKQVFSSFERFELYDRTTLSPVENVRIEYHLLIVLPQVNKPQSYTIEVNLRSRAAIIKRAKKEGGMDSDFIFQVLAPSTGRFEISYIDYTVARNFQVAIDGWFHSLKTIPETPLLKFAKSLADHYPFIFRTAGMACYIFFCANHFNSVFFKSNSSTFALYQSLFATFAGMLMLSVVSGKIGVLLGQTIRKIQQPSYLNLTRGDEIAFSELSVQWTKAWAAIITSIAINITSSWLASKIGLSA